MTDNRFVVGIDIGRTNLVVAASPVCEQLSCTIPRDSQALEAFARLLCEKNVRLVVMEASGGYERLVTRILFDAGLDVAVVQPERVRAFAKAQGIKAKNDTLDASLLATFGTKIDLFLWKPQEPALEHARELARYRHELVQQRTAEKNRLAAACDPRVQQLLQDHIHYLNDAIRNLESEIATSLQDSSKAQAKVSKLLTVPGIGPVTAARLVTELPELGLLPRRKIAALAGLAPFDNDSGQFAGRRTIRGGRRDIRTALFIASMAAIMFNPVIKAFYANLRLRGKPHALAVIACARKLLTILDAIIRNDSVWHTE